MASTPPTQIAAPGVRRCGSTRRSTCEKGRPPSRAKAYIMREHEVRPASAQRKFETTMPTMIAALRRMGMADKDIRQLNEFQPCLAPATMQSIRVFVVGSV